MKTHVIHLAAHDDYHSARDQMTWAKSARILLVLPKKERILRNKLDLVLLERQATSLGGQLAIVTSDEIVAGNAEELRIPVFETIKEAQRQSWKTGAKRKSRFYFRHRPRKEREAEFAHPNRAAILQNTWLRVTVFSLGVLAVLAILALLLPDAAITVMPKQSEQTMQFTLKADQSIPASTISGLVPVEELAVTVRQRLTTNSSGTVEIGETPAEGDLTITNLTDQKVNIPEGTVFMTISEPIQRFISVQPVRLDAEIGAATRVPIRAVLPGKQGNVPTDSIQGVEGPIGLQISVRNPKPTAYGSNRESPAPTLDDLSRLERSMDRDLLNAAILRLRTEAGADGVVLEDTVKEDRVLDLKQDPEVGIPSDILTLEVEKEFSGLIVPEAEIGKAAMLILDSNLPEGKKPVNPHVGIDNLTKPGADKTWQVRATRGMIPDIDPQTISQLAAGQNIENFLSVLSQAIPLEEPPRITIRPFFLSRFPFLPIRIRVEGF